MSRTLTDPSAGNTINRILPIHNGGSEEITAPDALLAFNGVPSTLYNQPNGVAGLNSLGKLPFSVLPASIASAIAVTGPELLYIGSKGIWTITNFDSLQDYTISCSAGFISRQDDQIVFTAPTTPQTVTITIDDKTFDVIVDDRYIAKPTITSPIDHVLINGSGLKAVSSAFTIQGGLAVQEVKSNTVKSDQGFGVSCAIDATGTRMIVGAYRDPYNATAVVGAVYIYRNDGGVWVQEAKLFGDTQNNSDLTGYAVDINADGTRVAFGSHGVDIDVTPDCGIVYVYVRSGTTWTREAGLTALDRLASAQLGTSVSISANGDRIVAGAPYDDNRGYGDIGAVYVFVRSGTSWTQEAKILSPDVANGNVFGYSVSVSDDGVWIVIGAAGNDYAGAESGLFYTYYRTGSTWNYEYTLVPADATAGDLVGASIAISGDGTRIAIGAPFATRNGQSQIGAVWVYYKPTTAWVLESKIQPSDSAAGDNLGWGLGLNYNGTQLVVGATNHDSVMNAGSAYVFKRSGNTWTQVANLVSPSPASGAGFGRSAAITADGSKVLVGAIGHGAPTYNFSGAAYVFDMGYHTSTDWQVDEDPSFSSPLSQSLTDTANLTSWPISGLALDTEYFIRCRHNSTVYGSSEWSDPKPIKTRQSYLPIQEVQKLTEPVKAASAWYGLGHAITRDGLTLFIGSHGTNSAGLTDSGAVYVYTRATKADLWVLSQTLTASDITTSAQFGAKLSLTDDGTRISITALTHTESGLTECGAVYIFKNTAGVWAQEAKLLASDRATGDRFGNWQQISGDGTRIVMSAYLANISATVDAGALYVFSRSGTTWTQEQKITLPSPTFSDQFGTGVSIDTTGSRLVAGCHLRTVSGVTNSGLVVSYTRVGTVWSLEASILNPDAAATDYFGSGLAMTPDGVRLAIGCVYKEVSGTSNAGAIYIFVRSGTTWTYEAKLTTADKAVDDFFGNWYGISINETGDIVAAGAFNKDLNGLTNCGQVYLFERVGQLWYEQAQLSASDKAANDEFGKAVTLAYDASMLIISSSVNSPSGVNQAGAAYIFQ